MVIPSKLVGFKKSSIRYVDPGTADHVKMDRQSVQLLYDALRRHDGYSLRPDWSVDKRKALDGALDRLMTAMSQITDPES